MTRQANDRPVNMRLPREKYDALVRRGEELEARGISGLRRLDGEINVSAVIRHLLRGVR